MSLRYPLATMVLVSACLLGGSSACGSDDPKSGGGTLGGAAGQGRGGLGGAAGQAGAAGAVATTGTTAPWAYCSPGECVPGFTCLRLFRTGIDSSCRNQGERCSLACESDTDCAAMGPRYKCIERCDAEPAGLKACFFAGKAMGAPCAESSDCDEGLGCFPDGVPGNDGSCDYKGDVCAVSCATQGIGRQQSKCDSLAPGTECRACGDASFGWCFPPRP